MTTKISVIDAIQWAFRGHDVGNFGHINEKPAYGIYFKNSIHASDLEKINQCNLNVEYIKSGNSTDLIDPLIVVVTERRLSQ